MTPLLAEFIKNPQRYDCLKHPIILQLESLQFSHFHIVSLLLFALAIIHTLSASRVHNWARSIEARQAPSRRGKRWERSLPVQLLFFLSEVEVIFAFWAIPLFLAILFTYGWRVGVEYINTRDYTEALFVAVMLSLAATPADHPYRREDDQMVREMAWRIAIRLVVHASYPRTFCSDPSSLKRERWPSALYSSRANFTNSSRAIISPMQRSHSFSSIFQSAAF